MSETVANGLKTVVGDKASETVLFVKMMDRFFDCLNVNNFSTGKQKRKPFQEPYRKPNDFRFKVCIACTLHNLSIKISMLTYSGCKRIFSTIWKNGKQELKHEKDSLLNRRG